MTVRNDFLILVVEPHDALAEALRLTPSYCQVHSVRDREELTDYLDFINREGSKRASPSLIIVELERVDVIAMDFLRFIKNQPLLKMPPIIIISKIDNRETLLEVYTVANCYIEKPEKSDSYAQVLGDICDFWISTVRLPYDHRLEPVIP
jgi:DNA-binding response OmpR family regulator